MSAESGASESHAFQTEVARLLHLMVHAVYKEKEIFLRELVSNASDACDKLRYQAIAQPELMVGDDDRLVIRIQPDRECGTLVISDNGIGMDHDELVANLGTIARSGTRAFIEQLAEQSKEASLIGQFGVGFYSAFMVADEIEVVSRKAGAATAFVWSSRGGDGFTVGHASGEQAKRVARGTEIRLNLKDDAKGYLEAFEIERIVRTYSDHILFPVELVEAGEEPRQINTASALWQRSKSEVTEDEYAQVYRTVTAQFDKPALTIHYKAEGRQAYAVLLFVPEMRPFDIHDPERKGRVKLYVRRVYITDDAELLPSYLRFVRGVVDSEDVPLNISREMLQNNPMVQQIRKALTQRVLSEIEGLAGKDEQKFRGLWETFGAVIKEGLYEDFERREQLLKLARFRSTKGDDWRTLAEYVADLRPNQTEIFYLVGESLERLKASPQLEAARARGIEVLLLADPIDHFWTAGQIGFEGKPLRSLTQGDVDLSLIARLEEASAGADSASKARAEDAGAAVDKLKQALGEKVGDVRISQRLVSSAVCLVAGKDGPDLGLEKLLARQDRGVGAKPVLEINLDHALIKAVCARSAQAGEEEVKELAELLLDQATILEGQGPADPARFAELMNRFMVKALG